jgi:hypothetical protein
MKNNMHRAIILTIFFAVLLTAPFVTIPQSNGDLWLYLIGIWIAMLGMLFLVSRNLKARK